MFDCVASQASFDRLRTGFAEYTNDAGEDVRNYDYSNLAVDTSARRDSRGLS